MKKPFALLCFIFIQHKCIGIDIDDINLSNCTNGIACEEVSFDPNVTFTTENSKDINFTAPDVVTTQTPFSTTEISVIGTTARKMRSIGKNHSNTCSCDIKISSCDINCCCDVDCNEFQLSVFSHCDNHRPKKYDSRYCYTKNFIKRNNTQFILERLASNLFCIAYDNLPPIYGMSEVPTLKNRQAFEQAIFTTRVKKYTWNLNDFHVSSNFNFSSHYRDDDSVWKFHNNFVKLMELPQTGLTAKCTYGKILKYLKASAWKCMQTNLSNNNSYLFTEMYNDFTIISSPHLFNSSSITSHNQSCPNNICLPVRSLYCFERWKSCNVTKPGEESCSSGKCTNVVKRVRYTLIHNGTNGIRSIEARFDLANVSRSYYQHFEVTYEWITELGEEEFSRSGNPGYTTGSPIIIGTLLSNVTTEGKADVLMSVNSSNYHLTLPLSGKNGNCISSERHVVGFGENVRMRCKVETKTRNFSSASTCMNLQNETLKFMLEDSLRGITEVDKYPIFVSKTGDLVTNDISKWTKVLLDRIPRNVVTGQIFDDKIRCSALVTSMHIEILHTILPNHEDGENYKIAGVALTFSEPRDISWTKCLDKNCSDILIIELTSFLTFTDISTPSMYYYAGGPNLDISLPYDFFYPFMSSASENRFLKVFLIAPLVCSVLN